MRPLAKYVLVLLGVGLLAFGATAPPEHRPTVTSPQLRAAATKTVDWFARNQNADGTWLYLYDADTGTAAPDYNVVRHAGAVMGLYQAAAAEIPGALDSADAGLAWARDRLLERHDWAALSYRGETPTGATALLVAGLAQRREATGDRSYDDLLEQLGRFLADQVEPSGAVLAYFSVATNKPVPGAYSKYYTGEAYWALAFLHRVFPAGGWGEPAGQVGHYLATQRDDAEGYWPDLPDHWAAYGLSEWTEPLTASEVAYARRQAELFGSQVRWVSQRFGPWGLLVRGPHQPRGGGYGVVGEALSGLWRVSARDPRLASLEGPLSERAQCLAGLAIEAQSQTGSDQVRGAWFRDGSTRMDDQQHALAALLRTVAIVDADDTSRSAAPLALWAVALLAMVNPLRLAFALPRYRPSGPVPSAPNPSAPNPAAAPPPPAPGEAGAVAPAGVRGTAVHQPGGASSRRDVVRLAALGGGFGALLVLVLAVASILLVEAMNVSNPALRIAAGSVGAIVAVAALSAPPPRPELGLTGWRAVVMPVAIPLMAGPGLVMLAISARADRGVGPLAVILAVGVALLAAAAAWLPVTGAGARVSVWAGRLVTGIAVATSILLVIDGILDV
jgi:small neutral amino acid transporter SnatA (MarC family)